MRIDRDINEYWNDYFGYRIDRDHCPKKQSNQNQTNQSNLWKKHEKYYNRMRVMPSKNRWWAEKKLNIHLFKSDIRSSATVAMSSKPIDRSHLWHYYHGNWCGMCVFKINILDLHMKKVFGMQNDPINMT